MICNKALWERVLVVFSVFSFCMSMLGSLPESLRYGYELEAAADDIVRRLTVEQTLALYGTTLNGTYYKKSNGLTYSIQFDFKFASDRWRPNNSTYSTMITDLGYQYGDKNTLLNNLRQSPFLVYASYIDPILNGGNAATYPWESSSSSTHANIGLNFSLNIPNVTVWDQYFMWSMDYANAYWYQNAYVDTYFSNYPSSRSYSIRRQSSQTNSAYAILPMYKMDSQSAIPDENQLCYTGWFHPTFGPDGNTYTITGQDLTLQNVFPYSAGSESGLLLPMGTSEKVLLLFIGCPQFSGFNVFPETTPASTAVTAGTTVSYQTYPTVDLSGLESGVGTMVQMQDEQNYYERIQIDQLNMIIAQLNAIYQAMVERGEVPVSLTDADSYPTLNNTVLSGVNDAITTYTMAQLPADQIGNGATGLTSFMFFLNSGPWMAIGLFFIGFAIFSWFIFRGPGI